MALVQVYSEAQDVIPVSDFSLNPTDSASHAPLTAFRQWCG